MHDIEKKYPIKAKLTLNWRTQRGKDKFLSKLYENTQDIDKEQDKKDYAKRLLSISNIKYFEDVRFFGHTDKESLLFIVKKDGKKAVLHMFNNKKELLEDLKCLNKIIYKTNWLCYFFPKTLYPIEYLYFYIHGVELKRKKRKKKIFSHLLNSFAMFVTPFITVYFSLPTISVIEILKAKFLIMAYAIITIIGISFILGGKHELEI